MQKLKGIWPLPGGNKGYVETLLKFLDVVNEGITEDKLEAWLRATYTLTGKKVIGGYIRVVEVELGLLSRVDDHLTLSAYGKKFLGTKDYSFLLDLLIARIVGFEEIFRILSDGKPHSMKDIYQNLVKLCNVNWKKTIQTMYRLNWLTSLGYLDSVNREYCLTLKGLEVAAKMPKGQLIVTPTSTPQPTAIEVGELTHPEMVRLMMDLGDVFGFESSENVRLGDLVEGLGSELENRTLDVVWRERYRIIPIEVQAHGSIDSLLNRLEIVEPKSSKMIVVSTQSEFQRVKPYLEFKTRSFKDKMVHISPEELTKVRNHLEFIRNLRNKIS